MFDRPSQGERAILIHLSLTGEKNPESLRELGELVTTAGARPLVAIQTRRPAPHAKFFIGSGKAEEVRDLVKHHNADMVVFDHALSPAQERNLERVFECRVLDRITIILDIFAQRASTFEGKLQVELAQLKYLSTRLVRGWTHLERQKGGIGLRGPGEKQLETDRRLLNDRIRYIDERLGKVARRRSMSRRGRTKSDVKVVALVGYTNAGKSTLFNNLTGAKVGAANRLFETLDPTLRKLNLPARNIVIADTVGFIRQLPHDLVAAFRATLEETQQANLLLHVVDASDQNHEEKREQVNSVLREIGAGDVPQLQIFNKIDLITGIGENGSSAKIRLDRDDCGKPERVWLSALAEEGFDLLLSAIGELTDAGIVRRTVKLPPEAGRLRARLFELGTVLCESTQNTGELVLNIEISQSSLDRLHREGLDAAYIAA